MLSTTRTTLRRGLTRWSSTLSSRHQPTARCKNIDLSRNLCGGHRLSPCIQIVCRNFRTSSIFYNDNIHVMVCPAFAESITEGDIKWEKTKGDSVKVDEVICEIETDKTSVPVPSTVEGVIQELLVEDGATVSPGTKLVRISVGESASAPAAAPPPPSSPTPSSSQSETPPSSAPSAGTGELKLVVCPPFADSITEGDVKWEKSVGETVQVDEVLCGIETDKTSVPVPSPVAGVIEAILVEDGTTVSPGAQLVKIKVGATGSSAKAASSAAPPSTTEAPSPPPSSSSPPPSSSGPIPTTPPPPPPLPKGPMSTVPIAAIRHANAIKTPPQQSQQAAKPSASPIVKLPPADPTKEIAGTRSEHRVKMNRMRLKIAQRLKDAQNTNAMLTTFNELDMSALMQLRKENQDAFTKRHGIKLGFMSAFIKASAYALTQQPTVNAVIEGSEIIYRDYVDISVAVATPKGLVVPVLRNVQDMNYADIEKGIAELGKKAKNNALAVEDMDGGTFTISNGGVFGSLMGTPIINPPQSAILGMHGSFERPVARNGQVVIRPMMYIALTYDHRLIDGREAVTFLKTVKNAVEDPRTMLLDL